jgi:integrase
MQFKQLAENYMAERANYKYSTLKGYRSVLNAHLLPAFGEKDAAEITSGEIRLFQVELGKTLAGSRVNTICQLLRCILHDAYNNKVIELDPSRTVKKVRQRKAKVEPFTDREVESILAQADQHFVPLFQTLLLTGMRPNEAYALTWEDVDFEKLTINIDKGCVDGNLGSTKTEASERVIPMVESLVPILLALKGEKATGRVLVNKDGREINGDVVRVWKRACVKAGVKYRVLYNLRHSWASRAITRGINIAYIAKLLGHSSPATTLKFYARFMDSAENEANFRTMMG